MIVLDKIYYLFIVMIFVYFIYGYYKKYHMHFEKALISINNVDDYFYKNRVALSTLKKTKIWVHVPFEVNS